MKVRRRGAAGIFEAYYRYQGKRIRFSTGSIDENKALRIAEKDFEDRIRGNKPKREERRVTFKQLAELLVLDYEKHRRRSLSTLNSQIKNLTRHFGLDLATDITSERIDRYIVARRKEGAADQTINNELAALSSAFRCARDRVPPLLSYRPRIDRIKGIQNVRQGFFEDEEFIPVVEKMPERYRPFLHFLKLTAMRKVEASRIERRQVDWNGRMIKLDQRTKNGRMRSIPLAGPIEAVVKQAWAMANLTTPLLFHDEGHQINFGGASPFTMAWDDARIAAGFAGKLVHDLRRTGIRNLLRAGNDPIIVKNISGHQTMSVFERYDMRGEADLIAAAEKLGAYMDGKAKPKRPKVEKMRAK